MPSFPGRPSTHPAEVVVANHRLVGRRTTTGLLVGAGGIAGVSGVVAVLQRYVDPIGLTSLYLFAIFPVAIYWGFLAAGVVAVASYLTFAFFFSHPLHSFRIADADTAAGLGIALVSAYIVSELARRAHERAREARARALEAERAQYELSGLADEQAALRRVATLVAQAVPTAEVFAAVVQEVGLQCDAELARMERFEPDGTVTALAAWSKSGEAHLAVGTRFALEGASIAAQVRATGAPARVDSFVGASGPIAREAQTLGIRSSVGCPVVVGGQAWGVIAASTTQHVPFPPDTESRIADFTQLAATAIANAQAREELRSVGDEQAALRRVATLVAQGAPPTAVFSAVAEEVGRVLVADSTGLARYEPDKSTTVVAEWSATGRRLGIASAFESRSTVTAPITVAGQPWGAIAVAWADDEPPAPGTVDRLEGFAELVATAIANTESQAELRASRARIVATADETRHQIERDLHDGAQQRLVTLALQLQVAQTGVPRELRELKAELTAIAEGLTAVLDELREMARGIHPAALTEGGLGLALKTLARRSTIPVTVDVRVDGRLPQPIEVAAYYVVSEALTNAAKHAHASAATIEIEEDAGVLRVSVRDDGVGGADFTLGSGLVGLKDRVEALGGLFSVESVPGEGTALRAELPLADGPDRRMAASATPARPERQRGSSQANA